MIKSDHARTAMNTHFGHFLAPSLRRQAIRQGGGKIAMDGFATPTARPVFKESGPAPKGSARAAKTVVLNDEFGFTEI